MFTRTALFLALTALIACDDSKDDVDDTIADTIADDTGADDTGADDTTADAMAEDAFLDSFIADVCATEMDCNGTAFFDSAEECAKFYIYIGVTEMGDGCEYDGVQAEVCLTELETISCEQYNSGSSFEPCDDVYVGTCQWTE